MLDFDVTCQAVLKGYFMQNFQKITLRNLDILIHSSHSFYLVSATACSWSHEIFMQLICYKEWSEHDHHI